MVSHVLSTEQPQSSNASQCKTVRFILTQIHWQRQTPSYSSNFFLLSCFSFRPHLLCQNILHFHIHNAASDNISKPWWWIHLKQSVIHIHTLPVSLVANLTTALFSRGLRLSFIIVWSLFHGGACEGVIGSRWGGPCVPPWWCQLWLREKHGGTGVGEGRGGGYVWEAADSSEVYRWADVQYIDVKNVRETLTGLIFFPLNINMKMKFIVIWLWKVKKMFLCNTRHINMQNVFTTHYLIKERLVKPFFILRISVAAFCCALLVEILWSKM